MPIRGLSMLRRRLPPGRRFALHRCGPNSPPVGMPPVDIEGNPRVLDGDGDGQAVVDMGIFEDFGGCPPGG